MGDWVDFTKVKPALGQDVLIYRQWSSPPNKHYSEYILASYIKNPYDKRRNCFVKTQDKISRTPMFINRVTHWMPLPNPPEKVVENIPEATARSIVCEMFGGNK